jgi:hypothetical protein
MADLLGGLKEPLSMELPVQTPGEGSFFEGEEEKAKKFAEEEEEEEATEVQEALTG